MTDRELLELAAKAAGIVGSWEVDASSVQGREYFNVPYDNHNMLSGFEWNPLRDDCDALRLAVKLAIDIEWRPDGRIAAYRHANANGYCFTAFESSREDRAAAARRAIVRAAAEIGKAMP
jgi:hypothetical protein